MFGKIVFVVMLLAGIVGLLANTDTVYNKYENEIQAFLEWIDIGETDSKETDSGKADSREPDSKKADSRKTESNRNKNMKGGNTLGKRRAIY